MKNNTSSLSAASHQQAGHAFKSMLLAIYEEVLVTDARGIIIERAGEIDGLWGLNEDKFVGSNLFELKESTFFDKPAIQELLNQQKTSMILTSWNEQKILVTVSPSKPMNGTELFVWGFKNISEDPAHGREDLYKKSRQLDIMKKLSSPLVVHSHKMLDVFRTAEMVSKVPSTVLLLGDSGVGKEMIAKAIHEMGPRRTQPFIAVNCGAIPENLLESELFGYEAGAFSGAKKEGAPGKFELANHGVLFLDEIAEMPLSLQVKLLRVLQEKEVTPLGGSETIKLDIQTIAATNKSLEQMVEDGKFREDLYYRLNVVPIEIPSLKERVEEIPYLIYHFVQKYNHLYHKNIKIMPDAIDLLSIYHWPGNVRQLENFIERIIVTTIKTNVDAPTVQKIIPWKRDAIKKPPIIEHIMPLQETIDLVEEQLINMAMEQYKSVNLAAKVLEISRPTMSRKYKKLRERMEEANLSPVNRKEILEDQLNKQLRSIAIVTAAIIRPEEIIQLKGKPSASNPVYQKIKGELTKIEEQEGGIEFVFIFEYINQQTMRNLVGNNDFLLKPGEIYQGSPEVMECISAAMNGKVGVTPVYRDDYGEWKTCFAPIFDRSGEVIALVGYDYSKAYVVSEMNKLGRMLNFKNS